MFRRIVVISCQSFVSAFTNAANQVCNVPNNLTAGIYQVGVGVSYTYGVVRMTLQAEHNYLLQLRKQNFTKDSYTYI